MKQEDKELLFVDLCARLPYNVLVHIYDIDVCDYDNYLCEDYLGKFRNNFIRIKPHLRPLSSMTEEEAKEIAILHGIKDILSVKVTSDYIDITVDDGVCSTETRTIWYDEIISSIEIFDYLNAHHFDYRGLIPKCLAIEAPDGMYGKEG